jgi:hypothetical protein
VLYDTTHSDGYVTLTGYPQYHGYWAWSERGQRWLAMTFQEHQAWLARPDLDPLDFVTAQSDEEIRLLCPLSPGHTDARGDGDRLSLAALLDEARVSDLICVDEPLSVTSVGTRIDRSAVADS